MILVPRNQSSYYVLTCPSPSFSCTIKFEVSHFANCKYVLNYSIIIIIVTKNAFRTNIHGVFRGVSSHLYSQVRQFWKFKFPTLTALLHYFFQQGIYFCEQSWGMAQLAGWFFFAQILSKYPQNIIWIKHIFMYIFLYFLWEREVVGDASVEYWCPHSHSLGPVCVEPKQITIVIPFSSKNESLVWNTSTVVCDPGNIGFEGFTQVQAHPPGVLVIRPEFPGHPRHIHCQPSPALGRETQPGCYFDQILRLLALSEDLVFIAI